MTFPDSSVPPIMQRNEYMFEESSNFIEWTKWDRLLREHSASRRGDSPPPQLVLTTPPSSPDSHYENGIAIPRHEYPDMRPFHPIRDARRTHSRRQRHNTAFSSEDELLGTVVDTNERTLHKEEKNKTQYDKIQHEIRHGHEMTPVASSLMELESLRNVARQHDDSTRPPLKAMSEGGFQMNTFPKQWTEFEYETNSFHLSNRHLSTPSCQDDVELGFPNTNTEPTSTDLNVPSAMQQPSSRPTFSQTQSEPLLLSSGIVPPARAYKDSMDNASSASSSSSKKWSPKRLACAVSFSARSGDSLGAFPSIPKNRGAFPSNASQRSVQTAPAAYIPLESKQHHQLEQRRQYLKSRQHLQFKRSMKELLEQEYSPHYVKSKTPSLLSQLTGSSSSSKYGSSKLTSTTRPVASSWKSTRAARKKDWFERSESKKGKMVSTRPRAMDLVFFETIPGKDQESFDIETIQEEEDDENEWDM